MRWLAILPVVVNINVALAQSTPNTGMGERGTTQPTTRTPYSTNTNTPSINQAASQGKSSQTLGMVLNGAAGAFFMAQCSTHNYGACAMGMMAFASAAQMAGAARQSGATYDASGNWNFNDPSNPYGPNNPTTPDFTPPAEFNPTTQLPPGTVTPTDDATFHQLVADGWKWDNKGNAISPSGKTFKPEDFKDKDSMMKAGMTAAQASAAMAMTAKANQFAQEKAKAVLGDNDPNVVVMAVDGGGGGAGGGYGREPASYGDDGLNDYLKRLKNPFAGLNQQKKAEMVAGKSINHGDDQIGVAVDDIFQMIHRRYQVNRANDQFIEPVTDSASAPGAANAPKTSPLLIKKSK